MERRKNYCYWNSIFRSRRFQLELSKEELWLLASSTKDDLIKAIEINKEVSNPDEFLDVWFKYKSGDLNDK